jgi:hypothetical protein
MSHTERLLDSYLPSKFPWGLGQLGWLYSFILVIWLLDSAALVWLFTSTLTEGPSPNTALLIRDLAKTSAGLGSTLLLWWWAVRRPSMKSITGTKAVIVKILWVGLAFVGLWLIGLFVRN